MTPSKLSLSLAILGLTAPLWAQTQTQTPPPATRPTPTRDPVNTLTVPPKSLAAQRLHPASFPQEAEVRCEFKECTFGVTRGFVLGANVLGMTTLPVTGSFVYNPGSYLLLDAFAGYQMLQGVDGTYYANLGLGWRSFTYKDSNEIETKLSGLNVKIRYAQEILPGYLQGLLFEVAPQETTLSNEDDDNRIPYFENSERGTNTRKNLGVFYTVSHRWPKVKLSMPADLELINWAAKNVDLPNHLRMYGRLEPFYLQNELKLKNYMFIEKTFGLGAELITAYESPQQKAGRYGLSASVGARFASSSTSITASNKPQTSDPEPADAQSFNQEKSVDYLLNLQASWMF